MELHSKMNKRMRRVRNKRAAALIIVLAFVVLVTALVVAYFSRTVTDRQVAHGSFNQTKADQLAISAADIIVADLKQEILNGSTATAIQGAKVGGNTPTVATIYTPTSNANMLPMRSGTPAPGATPIPNLVRISVRSDPIPAPGVGSRASAVNSTTDASANGRSISAARWNKHYLAPRLNASSTATDTTPVTSFPSPDWVLVSATNGPTPAPSPSSVIGRYAYAVYDEGGLLDLNAAGYPSGSTATQSGRKGSLAYADLTALPTTTASPAPTFPPSQVDNIVGWRNYATANGAGTFPTLLADPSAYFTFILSNTTGFLTTAGVVTGNGRTDQAFLNRQELISFQSAAGFSQNALQYFGTFSRELNSPSWSPSTPAGSTIDYASLANTPSPDKSTALNRNLSAVRVTNAFTRFDGSSANVGDPLIKTRFPLSRLAWITYKGSSASLNGNDPVIQALSQSGVSSQTIAAGTAANIQKCFGLTYVSSDLWTYSHGAANRILRLDEVAAAAREPDFFELLQAGILSGSLGQSTGGAATDGVTGGNVFPDIHMRNTMQHILSIGASIIDQADPDSIPTRIQFTGSNGNTWIAFGVENLPCITQLYPIAGTSPNDSTKWATYLLFQVWNPHQNVPSNPPSVRLRVDGGIGTFAGGNGEKWNPANTPLVANGQAVTLNSSASFSNPTPLTTSNTTNFAAAPGSPAGGTFAALAAPPVPTPSP
jgi:Tfp pilus assembly protein PilX